MEYNSHFKLFLYISKILMIESQQIQCPNPEQFKIIDPLDLCKAIVPELDGKKKGEAGKIGVIGGSIEYTGAPYFAAITALKIGADLVYVITTENAASVIKTYSPELIVYPYLNINDIQKVKSLLNKMDVVIIGPGIGREDQTLSLIYEIIDTCRELKKPLFIDADGLYAVARNISILNLYPNPGAVLTPNHNEIIKINQAMNNATYDAWGTYVSILIKGKEDKYSSLDTFSWSLSGDGSGRRAGGQGDILAGALGTFYNWALKANLCNNETSVNLAQNIASYAAAKITRRCNSKAFTLYGRSMTASDMLKEIYVSFNDLFLK